MGGAPFDIAGGEASIYAQYMLAINNASQYLYFENQHLAHPDLMAAMLKALDRGVEIVYAAPEQVMSAVHHCRMQADKWVAAQQAKATTSGAAAAAPAPASARPPYADIFLDYLPELKKRPNFCLMGLVAPVAGTAVSTGAGAGGAGGGGAGGGAGAGGSGGGGAGEASHHRCVYVHSKMMIVDDVFLLCGRYETVMEVRSATPHTQPLSRVVTTHCSANLVDISMHRDHTEISVAVWSPSVARATRDALCAEHGSLDTTAMHSGAAAMKALAERATANRERVLGPGSVAATAAAAASDAGVAKAASEATGLLCHAFRMDPESYGRRQHPSTRPTHFVGKPRSKH